MPQPFAKPAETRRITPRSTCRVCGGTLQPLLDLGKIVPSDYLLPESVDPAAHPLDCQICEACLLPQLAHTIHPDDLYRQYWYQSGVNPVMRQELRDVVEEVRGYLPVLRPTDIVIDVGANDGTLLACYDGPTRVAYEPAYNLVEALGPHAEVIINDFFPSPKRHLGDRSVAAITSIAMFYDLDDPLSFVQAIDRVLADNGVWILQFQDLAQMVETTAFDNLVHEHLVYYSLESVEHLLELAQVDLQVVSAQRRAINGGSLRMVVRRRHHRRQASVDHLRTAECRSISAQALERFAWTANERRTQIQTLVHMAMRAGRPVDLYAASTKSSTLLQYCGLDSSVIRQAAERTPEKWGRVTSGTRIPIVSEAVWRDDPAPVTLIGAWQFAEAFVEREQEYLRQGGMFLVPLPQPRVVR